MTMDCCASHKEEEREQQPPDWNSLLGREHAAEEIRQFLAAFEANKHDPQCRRGLYLYGDNSIGKTTFVKQLLERLGYDVLMYDASDARNGSVVEDFSKHNMASRNVISMLSRKVKPIVLVMDEVDGMCNSDKSGLSALIKIVRPKKTKKQKLEHVTMNPVVCISGTKTDKKIKELMKACHCVLLPSPTLPQMRRLSLQLLQGRTPLPPSLDAVLEAVGGNVRKLLQFIHLASTSPELVQSPDLVQRMFRPFGNNEDAKHTVAKLFTQPVPYEQHSIAVGEAERTSVGLLWHENVVDLWTGQPAEVALPQYLAQLENICLSDNVDRLTFQKQIWQFNDITTAIKTFKNSWLLHEQFGGRLDAAEVARRCPAIRFTKVLTKYATEYNNALFLQKICQRLSMEKSEVYGLFLANRDKSVAELAALLEPHEIIKLDIERMYRYLDKYLVASAVGLASLEKEIEDEEDLEAELHMGEEG